MTQRVKRVDPSGAVDALKAIKKEINRQAKAVNKEAGEIIADNARSPWAPIETGDLRKSIKSHATKTRAIALVKRSVIPYAGVIHYGWPKRGIEANPFLEEGLATAEYDVRDLYQDELRKIIKKKT